MKHKGEDIKTGAYIILHYGADYLEAVIDSIIDAVDEVAIIHTEQPSHGSATRLPLPEQERKHNLSEIFQNCKKKHTGKRKKFTWINNRTSFQENAHRQDAVRYLEKAGYQVGVVVDADEIWQTEVLKDAVVECFNSSHREFQTRWSGWRHFYRSFNNYCVDQFQPVRFYNFSNYGRSLGIIENVEIYHMGYAISESTMQYKLSCHGHKNEIRSTFFKEWQNFDVDKWNDYIQKHHRPDIDWTLHPASKQVWRNTQEQDVDQLPDVLKNHKYFGLQKIV